jgi:serine protease inhibitor
VPKPRRRYKDSAKVEFTYETSTWTPRRKLKKLFDLKKKAALLSELEKPKHITFVRNYTFQQFIDELQDQYQMAVDMYDLDLESDYRPSEKSILEWAEDVFDNSVIPVGV